MRRVFYLIYGGVHCFQLPYQTIPSISIAEGLKSLTSKCKTHISLPNKAVPMINHTRYIILQLNNFKPVFQINLYCMLRVIFCIFFFQNMLQNFFIQEVITERLAKCMKRTNYLPDRWTNPSSPILHESRFKLSNFVNPASKKYINVLDRTIPFYILRQQNTITFLLLNPLTGWKTSVERS